MSLWFSKTLRKAFCLHGAIQIKLPCHSVQTYFEDASFLPSDLFNGVSKNLGVIYTQ